MKGFRISSALPTVGRGFTIREPFKGSAAHKTLFLLKGYLLMAKGTTKTSRKSLFAGIFGTPR